jgi:hypothetical protein
VADGDDRSAPPPGWPGEAEKNELLAMIDDWEAMSAMRDAANAEREAAGQQGERDLQARYDEAARLASVPGALAEAAASGGTDYPTRLARMLHAREQFIAAFGILRTAHDVTQLEHMQAIGAEVIELARSLGQDRVIAEIELLSSAAAGYLHVLEEIGHGRGAPAYEAFVKEQQELAAVAGAADVVSEGIAGKPADGKVRAALAAAGSDHKEIRTILNDLSVPAGQRCRAAMGGASQALRDGDLSLSLVYAEIGVDLAVQLTDRGADLRTAEHEFAALGLLGPATYVGTLLNLLQALAAVEQGREPPELSGDLVDRVAALADGARGLLIARQFETRPDLQPLTAAQPRLAASFSTLASELEADPDTLAGHHAGDSPPPPPTGAGRAEWARARKYRASGELDVLIDEIRAEEGFAGFLRRLSPVQLRGVAAGGPAVMLVCPDGAFFRDRGGAIAPFALVVTEQEIRAIRLGIDMRVLDDAAARWQAAIAGISARGPDRPGPLRLIELADKLAEVLSLAWHDVVAPVLGTAGLTAPVAEGDEPPRLWWLPEGPLHKLPLHAAQCRLPGCRRGGCGAALDHVASSYLPSLRTLARIRDRAARNAVPASGGAHDRQRALLVAATDADLPGAEAAAKEAARRLRKAGWMPGMLTGRGATSAAVLGGLADAAWAHFGCHATSDPREPSGGLLHLPGGDILTVREVSAARPEVARLAFLAACSTARAPERIPGEAIHLANAFLLAGFSAAIGTLWDVDSDDARTVTSGFYARVTAAQPPWLALHQAVRDLRARRPDAPYAWAAYVHSGA